MSIIRKIEDKLSGHSKEDRNTLEKQDNSSRSSGDASRLRHPIGTSTTDNTGYGGSGVQSGNRRSYGDSPIDERDRDRDGYRTQQSSALPGGFPDDNTAGHAYTTDDRVPTSGHTGGTSAVSSNPGPRKPFYPFSRKGMQTAADAHDDQLKHGVTTTTKTNTNTTVGTDYARDPQRSHNGGILNQQDDSRYGSRTTGGSNLPTSSSDNYGRDTGSSNLPTSSSDRYGRDTGSSNLPNTSSDHHYGRDAGIAGGAGAAGLGAYEAGKHSGGTSQGYGQGRTQDLPSRDVQYNSRDTSDANYIPSNQPLASDRRPVGGDSSYGAGSGNLSSDRRQVGDSGYGTGNLSSNRRQGDDSGYSAGTGNINRNTAERGYDNDSGRGGGIASSTGAGGLGSTGTNKPGTTGTLTGGMAVSGRTHAQKMGEAYAAGYRDGYDHAKAESEAGRTL